MQSIFVVLKGPEEDNYFLEEHVKREEVIVIVKKFSNEKTITKITGKMVISGVG